MSPHVNPVSTTFAIQALEMWRAFEAGESEHVPSVSDLSPVRVVFASGTAELNRAMLQHFAQLQPDSGALRRFRIRT
jgi:hypothetical protein